MQIEGRVAVVTGASTGIGAAIARELSKAGAKLLLTARRADKLAAVSRELAGASETLAADVTDPDTPRRLLDRCRRALHVTAAGSCEHRGDADIFQY